MSDQEISKTPSEKTIEKKKSTFRELFEGLLIALLVAVVFRSFLYEPFKIPSGSMIPTLMEGDRIFVNKFIYGLRVPLLDKWIVKFKQPERGEVIVFEFPHSAPEYYSKKYAGIDFIKRVIGVPGDRVRWEGDEVYVNDKKLKMYPLEVEKRHPDQDYRLIMKPISEVENPERYATIPYDAEWKDFNYFVEQNGEVFYLKQEAKRNGFIPGEPMSFTEGEEFVVPEGKVFAMGDNRDQSLDSRFWGFVPIENIKGRASFIWLSLAYEKNYESNGEAKYQWLGFGEGIRWRRFGTLIY